MTYETGINVKTIDDIIDIEKHVDLSSHLYGSTWELLANSASEHSNDLALSFLLFGAESEKPSTWTYKQLFEDFTRAANLLNALGVDPQSPISIILPNLPETHMAIWGGQCAGVVNPINPLLEPKHIASIIKKVESETIITMCPFPQSTVWEKVIEAVESCPKVKTILSVNPLKYVTEEQREMMSSMLPEPKYPSEKINILDFDTALAEQDKTKLKFERVITSKDIAALFHTGGTTGLPKVAKHSHLNEVFEAQSLNLIRKSAKNQAMLCGLPLFHVNGVIVTGLAAFAAGDHVILGTPMGYRSPQLMNDFWKIIEKYNIVSFSCVPTILSALLNKPIDADISCLEYVICGAAPLAPDVFKRFEAQIGAKIIEGYGLTEGGCATAVAPIDGERRIGSVGLRLPFQNVQIAKLGSDNQIVDVCGVNEEGQILIKGPNVFPGYMDPSKNEGVLLDDGWLATGDLGKLDSDGYISITGRAKDIIIRGGHNIDPSVIEEILSMHDDVDLVGAVGKPDTYAGEVPIAFVTLKANRDITADALKEFSKKHISERAAVPTSIQIISDMPVTAVGKIFKPSLRAIASKLSIQDELNSNSIQAKIDATFHSGKGQVISILVSEASKFEEAKTLINKLSLPAKINWLQK